MVLYNRTRVSRVPNRIVIGMETISASELKSGWSRLRIDDKRIIWRHEQSDYSILLFISKWTIFTFLLRNMVWYMLKFIKETELSMVLSLIVTHICLPGFTCKVLLERCLNIRLNAGILCVNSFKLWIEFRKVS